MERVKRYEKFVNYEQVKSIPTPVGTATHRPMPHHLIIDLVKDELFRQDMPVIKDRYSLDCTGQKMSFELVLDAGPGDEKFMVTGSNSHDKTCSIRLGAALWEQVCTNGMYGWVNRGEIYRKHTSRLDVEELREITTDAVTEIHGDFQELVEWKQGLKELDLDRPSKDALLSRLLGQKVLSGAQIAQFYELFYEKRNPKNKKVYGDDMAGLHGAVTQVWTELSLNGMERRHRALNNLIDEGTTMLVEVGMIVNAE